MTEPECGTATLLANGKVLITRSIAPGPEGIFVYVSHAELYEPLTGTFVRTGDMNTQHTGPTATLLTNGKVLVAGGDIGDGGDGASTSAELYDPATGTFTSTDNMITGRDQHTATLLADGRVLMVGGHNVLNLAASAEIYDAVTGTFSMTGGMATVRELHTATLLNNGKVLITGGDNQRYWSPDTILSSAELYDPAPPIPIPRIIGASVAGKKLIVVGENFVSGEVILINGEEQTTRNDGQNPQTTLIGKKAGKKIKPGDRVQVRNPDGTISQAFTFTSK